MAKIPLMGGSYEARSIIADAQRCVNLYPEPNPQDAEAPLTHYPTPGLTVLALGLVGGNSPPPPPDTVVFLRPGDTSVQIPKADFVVEMWGRGGDNSLTIAGGGGAYSKTTYTGMTPHATYAVNVEPHGHQGGDFFTWFNDVSIQCAHGATSNGSGGQAAMSIGDITFSGGDAGQQGGIAGLSSGGGGAAGPGGDGKKGGAGISSAFSGGGAGGGGQGGGTVGADYNVNSGGDGGKNASSELGGAGGVPGGPGNNALNAGAGGGGGGFAGAPCGNGADDLAGGGGGGGGGNGANPAAGGSGGQPAGGAGIMLPETEIALGGDGLIRITYTP